jgi:glycosyltransferase involved in cell wall biosynthesis
MWDRRATTGSAEDVGRNVRTALLLQNIDGFPSFSSRRYAEALGRGLSEVAGERGWQVERPIVEESLRVKQFVGVANASRWGRLVRYPRLVRRWRREMPGGGPDVVHVLDHSHANLLRACDPARAVITVHDVIPMLSALGELDFQRGQLVKHTFARKLRLIKRCARVITPSAATKRQLLRFVDMPEHRITVVPHGVDRQPGGLWHTPPGQESPADERERVLRCHGIDPGKHRVMLHVCTRNRYKNSPAVLRALARLPEHVVLLRVGAPLFDDEAELARTLGVSGRVVEAGRVPGDDGLAAHYRAADVFVFPSTFEGFGWPPLEALACGTPVVCSNAASLPEVVGDAGILVDPGDDAALAEAVGRLFAEDDQQRADRRTAAVAWAERFSWRSAAERTMAVYEAVAAEADDARDAA